MRVSVNKVVRYDTPCHDPHSMIGFESKVRAERPVTAREHPDRVDRPRGRRGGEEAMAKKAPATRPTGTSVGEFLASVPDEQRGADAERLCALMQEITAPP